MNKRFDDSVSIEVENTKTGLVYIVSRINREEGTITTNTISERELKKSPHTIEKKEIN